MVGNLSEPNKEELKVNNLEKYLMGYYDALAVLPEIFKTYNITGTPMDSIESIRQFVSKSYDVDFRYGREYNRFFADRLVFFHPSSDEFIAEVNSRNV